MRAHGWKPIVFLGTTTAGVVLVMGLACLLVHLVFPDRGLSRSDRRIIESIFAVAGFAALGTGLAITQLLKKHLGHWFGTYLDDPDELEKPLPPPTTKVCLHCGGTFPAYRNDLHAAGFCSPGCREHYPGK